MSAEDERDAVDELAGFLQDVMMLAKPSQVPDRFASVDSVQTLYDKLLSLREFLFAASNGDLSKQVPLKGYIGGALKTLQSNLKHMTWQTKMVASGDFTQRVEFMGEFSQSFNAMVMQLDQILTELAEKEIELNKKNDQLLKEISTRKQAEASLQESEAFYRMLFENAPIGIIHFDDSSRITNCNDKFTEIIGASEDEIIGFNLLSQLRNEQFRDAVFAALIEKTGHFEGDYISVCGNKPIKIRALFQRVSAEDGEFIGAVGIFEDITERKLAEIEKEKLIGELQEALSKVKLLSGFLPICASCKKIRDDKGYWQQIEEYIHTHSEAEFSHGICPECAKKIYPRYFKA
jgi:PAS domain S-box-containing protein